MAFFLERKKKKKDCPEYALTNSYCEVAPLTVTNENERMKIEKAWYQGSLNTLITAFKFFLKFLSCIEGNSDTDLLKMMVNH